MIQKTLNCLNKAKYYIKLNIITVFNKIQITEKIIHGNIASCEKILISVYRRHGELIVRCSRCMLGFIGTNIESMFNNHSCNLALYKKKHRSIKRKMRRGQHVQ